MGKLIRFINVTIPNETYFVGAEFSVTLRPQNFHVNV